MFKPQLPKDSVECADSLCRKRCRASVRAESEGLAAVVALERHVSRHLAHSYTIAHAWKKREEVMRMGQSVT